MIKYTYVACLTVAIWFVFALYGLIAFMVNWTEAYSKPCQTSKMELLAEIVKGGKLLTIFEKKSEMFDRAPNTPLL